MPSWMNGPKARRFTAIGTAALVFTGCAVLHSYARSKGPTYSGPLLIPSHLFELFLAVLLLTLCVAIGRDVLDRWSVKLERRSEELVFSAALGSGVVATTLLLLGFTTLLRPAVMLGVLIGLAVVARGALNETFGVFRDVWDELLAGSEARGLARLAVAITGAVAFFLLVMATAPPVDWDAQMYHLTVPLDFLEAGRVYLPDDNLHAAFVGLVHMLYTPLLAAGSLSGPAILNSLLTLFAALAVWTTGARLFDRRTASLSLALVWGTTTILLVAITPRTDIALAFLLLTAHLALLIGLRGEMDSGKSLVLAAFILSFAFATKYHAVPYGLALTPLAVFVAFQNPRPTAARQLGAAALAGLVVASPWVLKNLLILRAPFYPFLAPPALEPWLVPYYGMSTVPIDQVELVFGTIATARQSFSLIAAFFDPASVTIELEGAFYYLSPALLFIPLALMFLRQRTLLWLLIPPIAYLIILIVPFAKTNLRYLLPATLPLTVAVAYAMVRFGDRFLTSRVQRVAVVALVALGMISSVKAMYLWLGQTRAIAHLVGATSAHDFMAGHPDPSARTLAQLQGFLRSRPAPTSGRLLMLFEARALYFDQQLIQDPRASNWPLLADVLEPADCLESTDVSHILVNTGSMRYYVSRGADPSVFRWPRFIEFAETCLGGQPIYDGPSFLLFERAPTVSSAPPSSSG